MLHPPAAVENAIRIVGHITGSPDAGHVGLKEFIDLDTIMCVQRGSMKQLYGWDDSNTRHNKVRWQVLARCQYDLGLAIRMSQGHHRFVFQIGEAMLGTLCLKEGGNRRCEQLF